MRRRRRRSDETKRKPKATLKTSQGQIDGFFSQLPFKCYLPEVASVGDALKICPWVASRVGDERKRRKTGDDLAVFHKVDVELEQHPVLCPHQHDSPRREKASFV